mmetsp:Transcript_14083/g.41289  ORF Transcript_14083/g.41289 Transcript_14083/m.41289 type:complete len:156 (-) Transcript_14083:371-838(-)
MVASPPKKRRRVVVDQHSGPDRNDFRYSSMPCAGRGISDEVSTMDVDLIFPKPTQGTITSPLRTSGDAEAWVAQRLLRSRAVMAAIKTPQHNFAFAQFVSRSAQQNISASAFAGGKSLTHQSLLRHFTEWGVALPSDAKRDIVEIIYMGNLRKGA